MSRRFQEVLAVLNKTVKYVSVVSPRSADGVVREVYDQARKELGMLPDAVTMFSASSEVGVATWAPFRETLLVTGHVPRVVKEAVAGQVSKLNECPYCVDAHTIMLYGGGAGSFATSLLSGTEFDGDPQLRAVTDWAARNMLRPAEPALAPFPAEQIPEIVGIVVEFHFLNRVVNVLLDGTFLPGTDRAKKIARRVAGKVMSKRIKAKRVPGEAAGLVGGYPLPADLSWAAPAPGVAAAYAALAAVTDSAAQRVVPDSVVELVNRTLDGWDGRFPGPSRAWLDEPLASLPAADRSSGRLALLTALAPFQSTDGDVEAYRAEYPDDADLLALLTWAAFSAARRIGAWSVPASAGGQHHTGVAA
jgi:AhpD family alkylhydroperoxidase